MGLTKPRAAQIYNLDYKQATRVVTTTNITLAGGAPSSVDGVSLSLNDRVLVTGQGTASQNGLYLVTTVGSGSNGTWARTGDANQTGEIDAGMIVMVTEGTIYADTQWKLITDNPITVGTTALTFTQNYSANSISSGSSNVAVYASASVTISSAGTPNVLTISSTGTITSGIGSVTGNIIGGNLLSAGIISTAGNATHGNILTAGQISATGNISGGNILGGANVNATTYTGTTVSVTANITGGNLLTGGIISTLGNIYGANLIVSSIETVTGNVVGGNLITSGQVSATGNITASYFLGNVACASGIYASRIFNGTSEANISTSGGNANISIGGTSNVVVFASTGEYVSGLLSVTGNITGGNIYATNHTGGNISVVGNVSATGNVTGGNVISGNVYAVNTSMVGNVNSNNVIANSVTGTLTTAAQPNVTSVGTLTTLSMAGNIMPTANNVYTIGSPTMVFQHVYVGPNSMYIGGAPLSTTDGNILSFNGNTIVTANTQGTSTTIGNMVITGNITGSNVLTNGYMSAAGNVIGNYLIANIAYATGYTASKVYNGTSEANIGVSGGNANISIGGTSNVVVFASTGEYVTGVVSATGNVTGGNIVAATAITNGNITITGANIVSTGPTIYIDPNGPGGTDGNVIITGNLSVQGNVTYINSNTVTTNDLFINVANNASSASQANGGGLGVGPVGSEYISLTYNSSSNIWVASNGLTSQGILSATGNVTGGNVITSGIVSVAGNIVATTITTTIGSNGNLTLDPDGIGNVVLPLNTELFVLSTAAANSTTTGAVVVTGGIGVRGNVYSGSQISATANITGGNVLTAGLISSAGNITGNNIVGGNIITGGILTATGNILTPANMSVGGNVVVTAAVSVSGAIIANSNLFSNAIISAAGNVIGNGVIAYGNISATGNVTSNYLLGNASQVTGVKGFNNIVISGGTQSNITANSIASTLTFAAASGSGFVWTTDAANGVITLNTGSSGISIFSTGGDMGLVSDPVTASEDLGNVADLATIFYDLGSVVSASGLIYPSQLILPTYTPGTLPTPSPAAQFLYLSTSSIGPMTAFSDGTNWRFTSSGNIVS